jgi:DNA (cytosine-5)-methyltransferase 1
MGGDLMRYGSLCTGVGQLDRAVEAVFGAEMAWCAEVDKDACTVLARHFPGVPNLGDLTAVDWEHVEPVDLICAGYPCQPFSVAGKRKGKDDHRHLWPHIASAIGVLRPRLVVLENVAGHLRLGFDDVLGDLAELGFDAEWGTLRASDIGACHRRDRLFVVAHAGKEPGRLQPVALARRSRAAAVADVGESTLADADGEGLASHEQEAGIRVVRGVDRSGDGPTPDAAEFPWGRYGPAIARHERTFCPAPWPVIDGARSLNGDFTAWMMGMPAGWLDGVSNTAKKRLAGNAVVTRQAVAALTLLHAVRGRHRPPL